MAHKLAIRVTPKPYRNAILLEINAHSLFSKYFSESGKLVMKMFSRIKEYLEDLNTFVVILIDEVESLTAARSGLSSTVIPPVKGSFHSSKIYETINCRRNPQFFPGDLS